MSLENPRWISLLFAGHRPSYLQKLNCAACYPWTLGAVTSRNIDYCNQKQPLEVLYKKALLKIFAIFTVCVGVSI